MQRPQPTKKSTEARAAKVPQQQQQQPEDGRLSSDLEVVAMVAANDVAPPAPFVEISTGGIPAEEALLGAAVLSRLTFAS